MATFYSNSTNQRESMPTFYLRDPGHAPYPESMTPGNMLYVNYTSSGPYSQHNCVELPVPTSMVSQDSSIGRPDLVASRLGVDMYNAWRDGRNEMLLMQTIGGSNMNSPDDLVRSSVIDDPQIASRTQLGILNGQNSSLQQSNVSAVQGQGLSLSLSTQIPASSFQYQSGSSDMSFLGCHQSTSGNGGSCREDNFRNKQMHVNASPYGLSSPTSTIPNSKYLKAAQQLLDEVVNVRKALKHKADRNQSLHTSSGTTGCKDTDGGSKSDRVPSNPQECTANSSSELSPSERQDLQNKVTKLFAMLDEVDRRYKQYYHQMQIVVSSFDAIAGCGAAKPYTALALQTISRHFRCLRDAISGQIRATRKSLGEQDSSSSKGTGISRLRFIDQQLRQQKTIQQLGMMQPHAWRPQRGLPETSVSVLRAWLFEHFLHPYPKDSDKVMLARQTGLSRSQVSNWFINARVRLWKPMIEEMHKEELGDTEMDSNSSSETAPKGRDEITSSEDREDLQSPAAEKCHASQFDDSSKSNLMAGAAPGFHNEANADDAYMNLRLRDQRPNGENYNSLLHDALAHSGGSGRFMPYQMAAELGRYGNGEVSLTLGLQHCDGGLTVSNGQQSFLTVGGEETYSASPLVAAAADYDCMNLADRRHRFGSSHLLHDFVA